MHILHLLFKSRISSWFILFDNVMPLIKLTYEHVQPEDEQMWRTNAPLNKGERMVEAKADLVS